MDRYGDGGDCFVRRELNKKRFHISTSWPLHRFLQRPSLLLQLVFLPTSCSIWPFANLK